MLEFNVKNQIISRTDSFDVVADSQNYLTAKFTFTEEWVGDIIAIFGNGVKYYNVILSDNVCTIPWEVIKTPFFTVSVVCGDRITANSIRVRVEKSGYTNGEMPKPPTPDVYSQILSSTKAPYIGENGNWFEWNSNEKAFVDTGVKAEGNTPQRGTDYWTEEDKAEMLDNMPKETFEVIFQMEGGNLTADKSFDEILNAHKDGKIVIGKFSYMRFQLSYVEDSYIEFASLAPSGEMSYIGMNKSGHTTMKMIVKERNITGESTHEQYPSALAVKNYVDTQVASLIDSAPETLDTLNELATALGNDPNFTTTIVAELGQKIDTKDIVDDLTTDDVTKPLSANQGVVLKTLIDAITVQQQFKVNISQNWSTGVYTSDKSFDEIKEVYNSGNANIVAVFEGTVFRLDCISVDWMAWVTSVYVGKSVVNVGLVIYRSGNIEITEIDCEIIKNRVDEITDGATYETYPSTRAVVDYVDNAIGTALGGDY